MDVVARRGETSKRSLYAHFESKEKLYLAVIDLVRGLFLGRLRMPGDYSDDPAQALAMFCGRYLEALLYQPSIQMCRVSMAETGRFPQGAAQHYDVMFTEVEARLGAYLQTAFGVSGEAGTAAAHRLIGQVIYPRYVRALFGIDELAKSFNNDALPADFDLAPIRGAVVDLIQSLRKK